jgi:SAUR family protein
LPPFLTLPIYICEFSSPSYISNTLSLSLRRKRTRTRRTRRRRRGRRRRMHSKTSVRRKICTLGKKLFFSQSKKSYEQLDQSAKMISSSKTRKVRKGYVAVYVGEEQKRYEVPLKYLSLPCFQDLIVQAEPEVLEPKIEGPIMLACTTEIFDQLLKLAKE